MLFLAALAHGLIILGVTFNSALGDKGGAPGLEVLLVRFDGRTTKFSDAVDEGYVPERRS